MPGLVVAALMSVTVSACGDPEPEDTTKEAARCGDPGAWSISSIPSASDGGVMDIVEGRVVSWSVADDVRSLHAAGQCGESPVDVPLVAELEGDGTTVIVGPHVLVLADDAAHRIDLASGRSHPAFGAVFPTMHATPLGVLALGLGGKLLLHPDPTDPDVEPTLLFDGVAWLPRPDDQDPPRWPHLWTDGAKTFALSIDFELMRIDLAGGEPELVLPDVEEFHVLDGGRKIAWRGLGGDMLHVTDLASGDDSFLMAQRDGSWNAQEAAGWALITTDRGRLLNLSTGALIQPVDFNPIDMQPTNTDNALLVGNPNGSIDRGYWLITPDGTLGSFLSPDPCLEFDSQVRIDGIVIADGPCEPQTALYNPLDQMVLRTFDGSGPRILGRRFGFSYSVLEGDWVLSWDEDVGTGSGRLSADAPDTASIVLGDEVSPASPVVEGLDAYYFQIGRGVVRYGLQ